MLPLIITHNFYGCRQTHLEIFPLHIFRSSITYNPEQNIWNKQKVRIGLKLERITKLWYLLLCNLWLLLSFFSGSSRPEVFLGRGVLKICSKFTGEHPCRNVISIKLLCKFTEIALRHGCSPVNLVYIFRTPFPRNTSGRLLFFLDEFRTNDKNISSFCRTFWNHTLRVLLILFLLTSLRLTLLWFWEDKKFPFGSRELGKNLRKSRKIYGN